MYFDYDLIQRHLNFFYMFVYIRVQKVEKLVVNHVSKDESYFPKSTDVYFDQ